MSKSLNSNDFNVNEYNKKLSESFQGSMDLRQIEFNYETRDSKTDLNILNFEEENQKLKEKNLLLIDENNNLQTEKAVLELTNKKNEEKLNILYGENLRLKSAMEKFEEMSLKLNYYEKMDLQALLRNSNSENQIAASFIEKLKILENEYGREIIDLKRIITHLKLQIDHLTLALKNEEEKNNNLIIHSRNESFTNNNTINNINPTEEVKSLRERLFKVELDNETKKNDIKKLIAELETQTENLKSLANDNAYLKKALASNTGKNLNNSNYYGSNNNLNDSVTFSTLSSMNNNIDINLNKNVCNDVVKASFFNELKQKYNDLISTNKRINEELESEKSKYISLLQMNQDLGKKIIENMKLLTENKSEIAYLKKRVAEQQHDKGEYLNDLENNLANDFEIDLYQEDKKKMNEIKINLEKMIQEQKMSIIELSEKIKEKELKITSLEKELSLEKMENENLKEIQKSDIRNISKILSEQSSQSQMKKNEDYITELKISLQNTNKINQELANKKTNLEKEILDLKNKIKEQQNAFLAFANEKDPSYANNFRDDKSIAMSKFSMASSLTQNKFFDSKIKDLEDTLIQEKENSENLIKIKQNLIDKLKKKNEAITTERNKLYKELNEEKMKISSLQLEKNSLAESEEYLKNQIQELNAELCDMRLNQEIYDQLEEKLEEYQRQFENLVNNYNNPQMQNAQLQKLIDENVELHAIQNKYYIIEKDLQEKNEELKILQEKYNILEKNFNMKNSEHMNVEYENEFKVLQDEVVQLKKQLEDNKLIIFSLREKCKDVISKEKEIFKLNGIISELNEKRKKRVSFAQPMVVEFQKEPSQFFTEEEINNNNNFNNNKYNNNYINSVNYNNQNFAQPQHPSASISNNNELLELLKSQQSLFDKYSEELSNIKSNRPTELGINIEELARNNILSSENINMNNNIPNQNINLILFDNKINNNNKEHENVKKNILDNNYIVSSNISDMNLKDPQNAEKLPFYFSDNNAIENHNIQMNRNEYNTNAGEVIENIENNVIIDDNNKVDIINQRINNLAENLENNGNINYAFSLLNSTLTHDINRLISKYNLNGTPESMPSPFNFPTFKDSFNIKSDKQQNKNNQESPNPEKKLSVIDKILQDNAVNLDNVNIKIKAEESSNNNVDNNTHQDPGAENIKENDKNHIISDLFETDNNDNVNIDENNKNNDIPNSSQVSIICEEVRE